MQIGYFIPKILQITILFIFYHSWNEQSLGQNVCYLPSPPPREGWDVTLLFDINIFGSFCFMKNLVLKIINEEIPKYIFILVIFFNMYFN